MARAGDEASIPTGPSFRYVALGDSYTIGTSVAEAERWPNQLVETIDDSLIGLNLIGNLAVNGFTSRHVIEVELPQLDRLRPDVVSVLIGVNDVVQGVPEATYRTNLAHILDELVGRLGAASTFVVTIPDFTVTPAGADYGDPSRRSTAIRRNNAIADELAMARSVLIIDIYDISLGAASDPTLVAPDGLHPSGAQYRRWVAAMKTQVEDMLAP